MWHRCSYGKRLGSQHLLDHPHLHLIHPPAALLNQVQVSNAAQVGYIDVASNIPPYYLEAGKVLVLPVAARTPSRSPLGLHRDPLCLVAGVWEE